MVLLEYKDNTYTLHEFRHPPYYMLNDILYIEELDNTLIITYSDNFIEEFILYAND